MAQLSAISAPCLGPFRDRVAPELDIRVPEGGGQTRLALQVGQEVPGVRKLLPDLRQEGAAPALEFEDDAIDPRPEPSQRLLLGTDLARLARGEERDLDRD